MKVVAKMGSLNVRENKLVTSYAQTPELKKKLERISKRTNTSKGIIIRKALEKYMGDTEMNKELTWKELVVALCELDAEVTSRKVVDFLGKKGITVTVGQVGAVKANYARGAYSA